MKAYVYPGDRWGCGSYRMIWPAEAVAAHTGWDVEVVAPENREVYVGFDFKGNVVEERFPADADVVVLQRPTVKFLMEMIPLARARGVAIVIDMDDDLAHIHPANPAFKTLAKRLPHPQYPGVSIENSHSPTNVARACAMATLVTVTTPRLAKVYPNRHGGTVVVPNFVPERYLAVEHVDSDLVGWGGSVHSHPDDLQQVGAAVAALLGGGGRFETVGMRDGVGRALGLPEDPPGPGPVALDVEWPEAIARFGVGIAPLADTVFNQAKSHLKVLEYNAVGVPAVASPSPDYQRWSDLSAGVAVARRPREWSGLLRALARDECRRLEMSEAGREAARAHTIEGNAWRWAEAWEMAVTVQRQSRATAGAT